ncbi:mannose-1-phosphate guanylyltransferase/mannose-6-phosphate isomerase [Alkalimarinus alittae]|uniref:mannose-1-phosphate guanylyltransferase n=1 Tax=Alkalimarinus alittae TaxID=2961619 RepID=A0ABY6N2J1_9ALTE|nr:mannose-1-phosphate guanylyltransferase/mannose-6-phosphate isomerase [Alkalimarinus alittae]UZE96303.1 mannose-1-phosphate guanylyltransferase/mannose-6-phosphate isomerase [Alkalimarinus alittae]
MIPVILSGGNGSRLWPISRKQNPKQFLPLVGQQTLFQQTIQRLSLEEVSAPVVVCNDAHRFLVEEQLEAINCAPHSILLEPFGRNTAPAVALAAFSILENGQDDVMLVLPADHVIENIEPFHHALKIASAAAQSGEMVLFGITPDKPETGFGYIQTTPSATTENGTLRVEAFVEKPNAEKAQAYLASGDYFWNSGMFMFQASCYLEELKQHEPSIYEKVLSTFQRSRKEDKVLHIDSDIFAHCPDDSIDYAVMEKTTKACVVPLQANWNDVGSWSALWDVHAKDENGNVAKGDVLLEQTSNCYVHGEDRMVALLGLDNVVVVDTKDALMVASKDKVQDVKKLVQAIEKKQRPEANAHREVYRPWGCYDSVDNGSRHQVKRITVKPGARLSLQKHHHRAEHWIVVSGTAEVTCGERTFLMSENQSTYIPIGELHRLANPGKIPLEIIEVQSGSYLGEDDIVRFEDIYGRVDSNISAPTKINVEEV